MSNSKKRKYPSQQHADGSATGPNPKLFIQAHEADLIHGPQAARSLEATSETGTIGDALIRWTFTGTEDAPEKEIWVDRYDARLLLDSLPTLVTSARPSPPGSPLDGWTDLPSDTEDMFFFSPEEVEDHRREKRRRLLTQSHEERLKAMQQTEGDVEGEDVWGGSDEEPDDIQKELMKRTANHLMSSPNPAQLEMRILANHGADQRFAFLRGRWSRFWKSTKAHLGQELGREKENPGLGDLAGYGSDEGDSEEGSTADDEEAIKAARRAKLKAWAEQRRAAKAENTNLIQES